MVCFKALASLKQNVRKYNKDFETMIANCRENPDDYNEEEEEDVEDKEDEDEASEGRKQTCCDRWRPSSVSLFFLLFSPFLSLSLSPLLRL